MRHCRLLLCLLAVACEAPPSQTALVFSLDADPLSHRHPFPSWRAHDGDGYLRVPDWILEPRGLEHSDRELGRAYLESLRPRLEELRGAGMTAEVKLPFQGEVDPETIADSVLVVDERGVERVDFEVSVHEGWIAIAPRNTWIAGQDHVVIVHDAMDPSGQPCLPSPTMRRIFDGEIEIAEHSRITRALAGAGVAVENTCLAFSFRVQSIRERLLALRSMLKAHLQDSPPQVFIDQVIPGEEVDWDGSGEHLEALVLGRYTSPELRGEDGVVIAERLRGDEVAPDVELQFSLAIPKRPVEATGEPIPVVMGLHGIAGNQEHTVRLYAPYLAASGFAYITIDGVEHGSRLSAEAKSSYEAILDVEDPRHSRDVFVQTLTDLMQLRLVLAQGLSVDGQTLATENIGWSGGSYGGIFGIMMSVADPELGAVHVEGCGGPWRDIITTTDVARLYVSSALNEASGLALNAYDPDFVEFQAQVAELVQWIVDDGDVSSYAQHVVHSPIGTSARARVLMQYWQGETLMPNAASERVARSMQVPWSLTLDDPAGVAGVWPYDVVEYGLETGVSAHGAFWSIEAAREQALEFLLSGGRRIASH